jgi:tetratricopeptide (TPR) repeat protein
VDTDKWLERGNAALAGKRWDEAQEAFVQALEVEPTSMPAWQGLWKSVRLRLDVETAEQLAGAIRAVEADAASATAWHDLGTALLGWHNTEAAIAFRQQAVLDPGDESGYSGLGLALSDERPDEALETVTRALELEPSASNWAQRSEVLSNLHRFEEAEAAATKALELEPLPYVSEWIALAVPLWCLDRKEEAAEAHLRATRIDPYDAYSFFRQAIESTGRSDEEAVEETIASLTAVTGLYPDDAAAWECLTHALTNNGWAGDAIAAGPARGSLSEMPYTSPATRVRPWMPSTVLSSSTPAAAGPGTGSPMPWPTWGSLTRRVQRAPGPRNCSLSRLDGWTSRKAWPSCTHTWAARSAPRSCGASRTSRASRYR